MSKEILFINGAVQNRDFDLNERPYKATGIVAARVLNHLVGTTDTVHTWNNVGTFADEEDCLSDERIAKKYSNKFMQDHIARWEGIAGVPTISTDDDPDFAAWTQEVMEHALSSGTIYQQEEEFIACRRCGIVIAEKSANIGTCSKCKNSDQLTIQSELGLFVDMAENRTNILPYSQLFNKANVRQEVSALNEIPPRLLLSRDRSLGVPLDEFGHRGKVLDPRLGIGMLALYEASRLGYTQVGIVQSYSTLIRTVPYLNSVITDSNTFGIPEHKYAFHGMIDPELLLSQDSDITPELLCLHALRQKANVKKVLAAAIQKERDSILNRKGIIEQLAARMGTTLADDRSLSLCSIDPDVMDGRLTNLLSSANKKLGSAIEATKHKSVLDEQQQRIIVSAHQHADSLHPII